MPKFLVELENGKKFQVEADQQPTPEEIAQHLSASAPEPEKPFLDISDTASALGRAVTSLPTTVSSSFSQAWEGLENPWKRGEGYLKRQEAMKALQEEMRLADEEAAASGDISSVSSTIREAIPSLGFSGATLAPSIAAYGGTLALTKSPTAAAGASAATSGLLAYRMAGAQFLDDARDRINAFFQENFGRFPDEREQEEAYAELLPLARKFAAAEAGPEALGNLALGGAGKYIRRVLGGKNGVMQLASDALGKVTGAKTALAGTGAVLSEIGTEAVTGVEQGRVQKQFEEGVMRGVAPEEVSMQPRSASDYAESFKEVAPTTLALTGMMGAAGLAPTAISRGVNAFRKPSEPQSEFDQRIQQEFGNQPEITEPTPEIQVASDALNATANVPFTDISGQAASDTIAQNTELAMRMPVQPVEEVEEVEEVAEDSADPEFLQKRWQSLEDSALAVIEAGAMDRLPAIRDEQARLAKRIARITAMKTPSPEMEMPEKPTQTITGSNVRTGTEMPVPDKSSVTSPGEAPLVTPEEESLAAQRRADLLSAAADAAKGKTKAQVSPVVTAMVTPQQPTQQENAVQEQITDEGVLRQERPEMELQGMGEQNVQPQETATEGQIQEEVIAAPGESEQGTLYGKPSKLTDKDRSQAVSLAKTLQPGDVVETNDGQETFRYKVVVEDGTRLLRKIDQRGDIIEGVREKFLANPARTSSQGELAAIPDGRDTIDVIARGRIIRSGTEAQPTIQVATERDLTKPKELSSEESAALRVSKLKGAKHQGDGVIFVPEKLMTPERRKAVQRGGKSIEVKAWADVTGVPSDRGYAILDRRARRAFRENKPVLSEAVDTYGIKLPEGYVKQGDLYVFQPTRARQESPIYEVKRDPAKVEQMTPDEFFSMTGENSELSRKYHQEAMARAEVIDKTPISVKAWDTYFSYPPANYVKQGDLYVFQPSLEQSGLGAGVATERDIETGAPKLDPKNDYFANNLASRAWRIAAGMQWDDNVGDWVHPDYSGRSRSVVEAEIAESNPPKKADVQRVFNELAKSYGREDLMEGEQTKKEGTQDFIQVGRFVKVGYRVPVYEKGEVVGGKTNKVVGKITRIMPDGKVEVRLNQGGFKVLPPSEIEDAPTHVGNKPLSPQTTAAETQTSGVATERDATKPAQMTPEEFEKVKNSLNVKRTIAQSKLADAEAIQPSKNPAVQIKQIAKQRARRQELDDAERAFEEFYPTMAFAVEDAIKNRQPFSTAAHKEIGMDYIPSGYVRQGDLYVFQPQATAAETQTPESVAVDSGAAGVVQSEPSRGSILEVEKESAKTAIESTEKSLESGYGTVVKESRDLLRVLGNKNSNAQTAIESRLRKLSVKELQDAFELVTGTPTKLTDRTQLRNNVLNALLEERIKPQIEAADKTFASAEREAEEELQRAESIARLFDKERKNPVKGQVSNADVQQAAGIVGNNGTVPSAPFTWMGNAADLLAMRNTPFARAFPGAMVAATVPNVEGVYENGMAFVFTDQVVVTDLDRRKAAEDNVSPSVAAAMRVITHENYHKGLALLPAKQQADIMAFLRSMFPADELDALARSYRQYADWRTNAAHEMALLDERLQKYIEETKTIPTDGVWKQFWDYIKAIWRKWTGKPQGEPTLQSMKDVVRLIRKALKDAHKQRPDQTKGGDRVLMSYAGTSQFVPAVNLNGRIETGTSHYEAWLKHAIRQIPSYKKDGLSDSEVKDLADRWLVDHPEAMANSMTKEGFVTDEGYLNRQDSLKKFLALGGKQRLDPGEVRDWLDSSDLEDARFSISYASETSQASSLGQQTAREMTASPRKLEAIIGVRQAYESMPKVHGNAVSLAELFDAAAKIVPNLTQVEFNSVVQGMYEDNAALLDNAETPSSIVILPNGAMMSVAGGANDAEYLAAVEAGDMEKAQRMVDEAAKAAGYNSKWFRQDTEPFSVFSERSESQMRNARSAFGYFFADRPRNQIEKGGDPNSFFIKDGKFFDRDAYGTGSWDQYSATRAYPQQFDKAITAVKALRDSLVARGYDGLDTFERGFGTIRVVFPTKDASSQIKSAAPVTYDDAGNVIPLSQRFQPASPDIRFSIASTPEQQSAAAKFKSAIIEAAKGTNKQRDYEGRPIKDRIINPLSSDVQDFVEIGQHNTVAFGAFMDAADEMLESMVKDGMSLDEILSKIQSSSFQQELGMFTVEAGQGMAMKAVMGLLLRKTANAERSAKTKAEKIQSSMLHRKAANYFTAVASTPSGQNLYALKALYNDPRTRFIFMENRALADMLKKADHGVNMRFDGAYGATQEATDTNVNASATAATKNIADQAEEAEEDDQDAIDLAAGEATLTDKQKSAWERFKDAIRTKGLIAKALQAIRSGNKAKASISAADRNAIFQMTEEELLALDAKMDKIMFDAEEVFFAESDAATRKKREKMAQTAQKRAQKGKEIEVTPTSLGKIINQARRDIKGPTGKPIQWREIFRQPAKSVEEFRKNILLAIMGNDAFKDMDDAQKRQIADMFAEAWGKEREKVLNQLQKRHEDNLEAQGKREAAKALREARNQILEIANLGVFSNDELTRILGEKFGFKTSFTEAEQQKLSELAEKIQDESLSKPVRNKLAREFLATLQSGTQISIAELLSNWWVASVLSGGNTITAIALSFTNGTGIGILGTHIARAIRNMVKGDTAGAIEAITSMFKAYAKHIASFPSAANRAWNYLWTGDVSLLEASANDPFKNVRSLADIARYQIVADQVAKDPNKVKAVMGRFMQFMGRLLSALDAFNVMITKAGTTSLAIRQSGLTADQIRDAELKNDLKFYKDKIIREDPYFNGKAPTSSFDKAYLASLAEAALYKDLAEFGVKMENADYLAAEAAMTMTPTGVGGIVYNKIKALDKDITTESRERLKQAEKAWAAEKDIDTGLKLFTWRALNFLAEQGINALGLRFARFAGNKFNQSLSYIPVLGALRVFETGNKELAGREEAFKDTIIRNQTIGFIMIIAGMKIIEAIADEPDDKKRGWFINGGWNNLTIDRKKQRLSLGEKEYTIGMGDQVFNYQNWPIGQIIAAIGEMSDLIRFSPEKWKEKTTVGKLSSSLVSGMTSALEIPALTQVSEIFDNTMAAKDPSEQTISRLSRVMAGWAGGFMPRFLKDIDYMLKPEMRKYESFYEKAASHIPIYRSYVGKEYYDILGNQIKKNAIPGSRDFDRLAQEPEYKMLGALNARGIWLTPANAEYRMIGKGRYRRRLTQEEADRYSLETGKLYKQMIMRFGPRALQMPVEQAKDYISAKADDMRDLALLKAVRN